MVIPRRDLPRTTTSMDDEMHDTRVPSVAERRRRDRRIWLAGWGLSVALHLLVFLLWSAAPDPLSPFAAAGPPNRSALAASGGMQAVTVRVQPPVPLVPPEVPLPTLEDVEPPEIEEVAPSSEMPGLLGDRPGEDEGPGIENGRGEGDGGTAEEGLFRVVPPQPRGMIIPPSHESLRGREVEVWVFVDERGRVVADSTHLRPPTRDGDFNRRLIEEAAEWVFRPATQGGEPVASWYPYRISM